MLSLVEITAWHWVGFIAAIVVLIALDLGVFHRAAHAVTFKEALGWTAVWVALSMLFAGGLVPTRGREESLEFITGYLIELSLSMDNVFVMALIFQYFRVPLEFQHRVLFWGILGALMMRGFMIWLGTELIHHFSWALYVFGAFLVITGIKMLFSDGEGVHPERNLALRCTRRVFPVSHDFEKTRFFTRLDGKFALTPLALVLVMVETTDLIFAVDSIPAVFAITQKPFIVFTSNVFAILGLRSLYFVLAKLIGYFRYLQAGLSIVLVFIGAKMLVAHWNIKIPIGTALAVVVGIIGLSILCSVLIRKREDQQTGDGGEPS